MLLTSDLKFNFPQELVSKNARPRGQSRIFHISRGSDDCEELQWPRFLAFFQKGDTLILNDTKVLWARLIIQKESGKEGEIFFLKTSGESLNQWEVLAKNLNMKAGRKIELPGGIKALVKEKGRISKIQVTSEEFTNEKLKNYFLAHGEVPLPPYITSLRSGDSSNTSNDRERYQTIWAKYWGSVAAPTAGLHFTEDHLRGLRSRGVKVEFVTLHVGAGTFLPVDTQNLNDFKIHSEFAAVGPEVCSAIRESQGMGKKVWACGTTALRALESAVQTSGTAGTRLPLVAPFAGETKLFITPGYKFEVVNGLLTNFHQPESTLLALVSAFATETPPSNSKGELKAVQKILRAYEIAIEKKFRLFSYGDLTVIS